MAFAQIFKYLQRLSDFGPIPPHLIDKNSDHPPPPAIRGFFFFLFAITPASPNAPAPYQQLLLCYTGFFPGVFFAGLCSAVSRLFCLLVL